MPLTIYQKSVYLTIFKATGILRSVGINMQTNERKRFVQSVFKKIETLTDKMDNGTLEEEDILQAIRELTQEFNISFGQAQKPINVILKYHFYLTKDNNNPIIQELHCPIDSVILKKLGRRGTALVEIDEELYLTLQAEIQSETQGNARVEFDRHWDDRNLDRWGLEHI